MGAGRPVGSAGISSSCRIQSTQAIVQLRARGSSRGLVRCTSVRSPVGVAERRRRATGPERCVGEAMAGAVRPDVAAVQAFATSIIGNVERVIVGKRDVVELTVVALLCEGHVLFEDVPGVGK